MYHTTLIVWGMFHMRWTSTMTQAPLAGQGVMGYRKAEHLILRQSLLCKGNDPELQQEMWMWLLLAIQYVMCPVQGKVSSLCRETLRSCNDKINQENSALEYYAVAELLGYLLL